MDLILPPERVQLHSYECFQCNGLKTASSRCGLNVRVTLFALGNLFLMRRKLLA